VTDLFDDAGPLREAYRGVDWAAGPLGPVSGWSPTLRAAMQVMLHTRHAVTLMWGREFTLVYNEAYVRMIGDKHPAALGAPARQVFPEIWDDIGPMLESVRAGRGATWVQDMKLLMDRHGFREETYFTFSYSAVTGPAGEVEGVIDIASETTTEVIGRRRLELLVRLNDRLGERDEDDVAQLRERALPVLRAYRDDLPGVDIVLGAPAAGPDGVQVAGRTARVRLAGAELVTGLGEHLPVDADYLGFLRLLGAALTQRLNRLRAREAGRRAAATEREMSEALQRSLLTDPVQLGGLQVAVRYHPAAEGAQIGGDWYDSFRLPDGSLTVVVGDVTGHDRYAAAAMSQIRNLLRGISYTLRKPPARVLSALNEAMIGLQMDALATVVLAQIDPGTRQMRWANAGHPPPMLLTPDGTVHLLEAAPEIMLGTRSTARRSNHSTVLVPGSTVVFYTDGLVERRGVPFDTGLKELAEALRGGQDRSADELCGHLLDRFAVGTEDDVVLAVVRAGEP
jgi:hypothetical protein